jgi:hypothetical protein
MASIQLAAVVLALLGTPDPGPLPVDDLSRFESAPVEPVVAVEVTRTSNRVVAGRQTTYTITVQNPGETAEPATVRVSVPPGMAPVTPDGGGVLGDGHGAGSVTVEPGATATVQLTGAYARPEQHAWWGRSPARVVLTACVLDTASEQPVSCATDIAELHSRSPAWQWLLVPGVAVVGAVALVAWRWRRARTVTRPGTS